MKITKEEIMKVVDNPKVICWSDVLSGLGLVPVFEKYLKDNSEKYSIKKISIGKTLLNTIDNILQNRIVKSKDKRVVHLRKKWRLSTYGMDCLQSMPTTATDDIDYLFCEDL